MSNWKIALAVGALIAVSIVVGAVAYASIVAVNKPATYSNAYAPGSYGNYPSTGNTPSQYPTTPAYPTQPNAPTYPNKPPAYYPPEYSYPYGGYGERETGPWGGMG